MCRLQRTLMHKLRASTLMETPFASVFSLRDSLLSSDTPKEKKHKHKHKHHSEQSMTSSKTAPVVATSTPFRYNAGNSGAKSNGTPGVPNQHRPSPAVAHDDTPMDIDAEGSDSADDLKWQPVTKSQVSQKAPSVVAKPAVSSVSAPAKATSQKTKVGIQE